MSIVLSCDYGRFRGFGWNHQLPPYSWGRPYFRQAQEYEEFRFSFARMHILWLDVARYFLYVSVLPSPFFFFFFLTLGTLFCIYVLWRRGTRGSHVFGSDWTEGLVSGGNFSVSRIFQGKKKVPLTSHFCSFFPLATLSLSFCVWCLRLPALHILPFAFSVSP